MPTPLAGAPVAVVGVAFELPQCADWDQITDLLRNGVHCMRPLPAARAEATGVTVTADAHEVAWLTDITGFDHRYFGMSRAEAELVDPRQRKLLQLAVRAIGQAGYAPAELRTRDVATIVAAFGGPHPTLYDPPSGARSPPSPGSSASPK